MKPINVLLVTNNSAHETKLLNIIEKHEGIGEIICLRSGREAIAHFMQSQTDEKCLEPDLIICDINLQSDDFFDFFNFFSIEQKAFVGCMVPQDSMDNFACGKFYCIERPFTQIKLDLLVQEMEYSLFYMH